MGGGLLQLVAYGAQDVYLTGNPQITFRPEPVGLFAQEREAAEGPAPRDDHEFPRHQHPALRRVTDLAREPRELLPVDVCSIASIAKLV